MLGADPGDRAGGRALRERIGLVLQDIAVEPYLTVRETIARNAGYYPAPRDVNEVIDVVGLTGQERHKVRKLSGGQKRRLDLALGLIGAPGTAVLSTNRRPASIPARAGTRGRSCAACALTGPPSCSPLTTWTRPRRWPTGWRCIADGQIVAEGPPSTHRRPDTARARIRFALPGDARLADLPFEARAPAMAWSPFRPASRQKRCTC